MVEYIKAWLLPLATLATAVVALITVLFLRKQFYWDKAPIIEIEIVSANQIVKGKHISTDEPAQIAELAQWNHQDAEDNFAIAQFTNQQSDPMGVARGIKIKVRFTFPHPSEPNRLCKKVWKYEKFWLMPKEKFLVVLTNLRGLPTGIVDVLNIRWYDIKGSKHKEARGFCRLEIRAGQRVVSFKSLS